MTAASLPKTSMNSARWKAILNALQKGAWAFFLFSLPVTSFPFMPPALGGGALVRPLAIYPLLALLVLVTLPRLLTGRLPKGLLALLPFALVALVSSALSLLRGIEPSLGVTVEDRILRGLSTLAVGGAIYFTVALTPRTAADLRSSLRWLYAGFGVALLWGSLQAVYVIHFVPAWYKFLLGLQRFVSIRRLIHNRISGMTYEPNWFAEQICMLLLPWLLASVLGNYTVFPWRWRRLTVEMAMLAWAVAVLPFTFSRAGVLNLVALAVVSVLFFRPRPAGAHPAGQAGVPVSLQTTLRRTLPRRLLEAGVVLVLVASLVYAAGTRNEFFARIWGYWDKKGATLSGYLEYLGFGARFVYSETGFRTYEAYPVLGVGLGNYAFYFEEMLPDRPLANTPEVLRLITPEKGRDRLITAKNLYFRILAETGLVGLAAFLGFLSAILGGALFLWLSPRAEERVWGTAGLLGLLVFLLAAISFDSLALPNMWVVFGLVTAAAQRGLSDRSENGVETRLSSRKA